MSEDDKPTKNVEELFKTMITTAGIMLPLLWGLTQRQTIGNVITTIRIASITLMVSIVASILGSQFIVTKLENKVSNITKQKTVAYSFLVAWLSFIVGGVLVIVAIFQLS
jgi:hypothetical protein